MKQAPVALSFAVNAVLLGMMIAHPSLVVADDGQSSGKLRLDNEQVKRWIEFYQREAEEYNIFLDEDRRTELKLRHKPVFRWASPNVNNEFNGVIFVWTRDGRPEVVGSIWSSYAAARPDKRRICHSFHSLALGPLHADRKGELWWHPTMAGIELISGTRDTGPERFF